MTHIVVGLDVIKFVPKKKNKDNILLVGQVTYITCGIQETSIMKFLLWGVKEVTTFILRIIDEITDKKIVMHVSC
jgi:hypothetical protein